MAKATESLSKISSWLDLERSYLIFAVIYFPITILFLRQGIIETLILAIYSILMFLVGLVLIFKFVLFLGKSANEGARNYGSILIMYVIDVLFPLLMAKLYAHVFMQLLPGSADGILCNIRCLSKDMYYYLYDFQNTVTVLIIASFVVIVSLALWSVGRPAAK